MPGHQVSTLRQACGAVVFGENLVHTQCQGIRRHFIEVIRIHGRNPVQLFPGGIFQVPPQTQNILHGQSAQFASASAVSRCQTAQELGEDHQNHHRHHFLCRQAKNQPQHQTSNAPIPAALIPQMQLLHGRLEHPGTEQAKAPQQQNQQDPQEYRLSPGHRQGYSRKYRHRAGQNPEHQGISGLVLEESVEFFGGFRNFPAQPGVMIAGAVHQLPLSEQALEAPVFKAAAFISHFHPFMEKHPSVIVQLNENVAQLGPGDHHQGQVSSGHGQPSA